MSEHWEPVIPYVYRRGALIQRDSGDCGRWVNFDPSVDWVCEECSKYYKQKYEVTQDGITWVDSGLRRKGAIYDTESDDCCIYRWLQMSITDDYWCDDCGGAIGGKWSAYYKSGFAASAVCDSSSIITYSEVPEYNEHLSAITSVEIGNCVERLGYCAFSGDNSLTSVTIGSGVTSMACYDIDAPRTLGNEVFIDCSNVKTLKINTKKTWDWYNLHESLESVVLGNSVEKIDRSAFHACSALTSITIPSSVTSIGEHALDGTPWWQTYREDSNNHYGNIVYINDVAFRAISTGITSCAFKNDTVSISPYAFSGCSSLTSVTIPNSVKEIGLGAFSGCSSLTSVIIPNSVTSIDNGVFSWCTSLSSVTIPDSVTRIVGTNVFYATPWWNTYRADSSHIYGNIIYINNVAYQATYTGITSCTFKNGTVSITDDAFIGCRGLTSVNIPNGVTSIGTSAFGSCSGLTSVSIPDSVTEIGNAAFINCSGITNVALSNNITEIKDYTFSRCLSLTNITIPDSVTRIGLDAFAWCSGLTSINTNKAKYIESDAFYKCSGLTSVILPDAVEIGPAAFTGCTKVRYITIGNKVKCIGSGAFVITNSYSRIRIEATKPPVIFSNTFDGMSYSAPEGFGIFVPAESVDLYRTADVWRNYAGSIRPIT